MTLSSSTLVGAVMSVVWQPCAEARVLALSFHITSYCSLRCEAFLSAVQKSGQQALEPRHDCGMKLGSLKLKVISDNKSSKSLGILVRRVNVCPISDAVLREKEPVFTIT